MVSIDAMLITYLLGLFTGIMIAVIIIITDRWEDNKDDQD